MFSLDFIVTVVAIVLSGTILQHVLLSAATDEPPFIKGPVPFLGSALAFARDPQPLLRNLQQKYGRIFTVYVAGQRMTFLWDPIFGNRQAWNNTSCLSLGLFTQYIVQSLFGFTKSVVADLEFLDQLAKKVIAVLSSKPLLADIIKTLQATYLSLVDDNSRYANCDEEVINLYEYCRHNVYYSSARALFGPGFPFEKIYQPYIRFEDHITKFLKLYPRFLNKEGYNARQEVLDELGSFFADPHRVSQSSVLVRSLYDIFMASTHKSSADFAGYFFAIIFASKSNSVPAAFWVLANIVADAGLKAEIERIIATHYDPESDEFEWTALMEDPLIMSCFKETLRLNTNILSGRLVTHDLTLKVANQSEDDSKNVRLREGSTILMPLDMLHWNPEVYPDPMKWIGKRFLDENKGVLIRNADKWRSYAPWGGGGHICPGRHLAVYEAVIQLVYTLARFDVEPIEDLPAPIIGDRYGAGMLKPERGYHVKFTRRKAPLMSVV
ncbi:cytochrome P450 [Lipomyces tetrasporus]|uniref:sterol 14alpha-demethylase n=1 Tax=Lipomyces tetrasporus TaxID=54092 RepID=A0AAD7QRF7_9ASCO|nr:cytochrome P450 [Lipomyces tetrasporus]KAJ8099591.1 cytochrome P450 [Lipomyces tetrasporus]